MKEHGDFDNVRRTTYENNVREQRTVGYSDKRTATRGQRQEDSADYLIGEHPHYKRERKLCKATAKI